MEPGTDRSLRQGIAVALAALLILAGAALVASGVLAADRPGSAVERAAFGDQLAVRLQSALDHEAADLGVPGATAAVVDDGRLVWSGVTGSRTLGGAPVEADTRFVTASAGKSVTAAVAFRLVDQGLLSLRDRVSEYLPDLRGAKRIRIWQLLNHSSGLPDYLNSAATNQVINQDPHHIWTRDEVLDSIHRLRFRPGSRNSYSNTNYIALGGVIEEITGTRFEDAFQNLVGGPLGLSDSSWRYDPALFDEGAHPYYERRGKPPLDAWPRRFVATDYVGDVWTDGGLATTGTDLARFANALVAGDLISPETRDAMTTFRRTYGLGVFQYGSGDRRIVGHDGLYGGFSAQHWTFTESGVTIAVLANLEMRGRRDSSWAIWKRLARVALSPSAR